MTSTDTFDLVHAFADLPSDRMRDNLRLVALKSVDHRDGIVPSRKVAVSSCNALVKRGLLTKWAYPYAGYKLTDRGAAMMAAINAPRITWTDPRQVALEFVARGRVTVRQQIVGGIPTMLWLIDGVRVSARDLHLIDLWGTGYVTVPGRYDPAFADGPVMPTDGGHVLRAAWLEEHGSPFPSERFVPFVTHTVTRDNDGRVYQVLGSELGAVTLIHESMMFRDFVVQADELAAGYTATGYRPKCRCEGTVACDWEHRDDRHVSFCLRCGKDR